MDRIGWFAPDNQCCTRLGSGSVTEKWHVGVRRYMANEAYFVQYLEKEVITSHICADEGRWPSVGRIRKART